MPEIESGCHELRVKDESHDWRVAYAVERDAILILEVFEKGSKKTPKVLAVPQIMTIITNKAATMT
jgi:phage-related protein